MSQAGRAHVDLTARDKDLQIVTARVHATLRGLEDRMKSVAIHAQRMLLVGGGAMIGVLKLASDAEEVGSKFDAVFKEQAETVRQWAGEFGNAVGRSQTSLESFLGTMQDTFVPMGFARGEAAELSKAITELAIDLASFNNSSEPEVIAALQSAIVGNHETMRRYGVIITETTLAAQLLKMGIEGGTKAATEQQKIMARLEMIMAGTTDAQGDAARTAGGAANQWKALTSQLQGLGIAIGRVFLPVAVEMVQRIRAVVPAIQDWVKQNASGLISTTALAAKILVVLVILPRLVMAIRSVVTVMALMQKASAAVTAAQVAMAKGTFGTTAALYAQRTAAFALHAALATTLIGALALVATAFVRSRLENEDFRTSLLKTFDTIGLSGVTAALKYSNAQEDLRKALGRTVMARNEVAAAEDKSTSRQLAAQMKLKSAIEEEIRLRHRQREAARAALEEAQGQRNSPVRIAFDATRQSGGNLALALQIKRDTIAGLDTEIANRTAELAQDSNIPELTAEVEKLQEAIDGFTGEPVKLDLSQPIAAMSEFDKLMSKIRGLGSSPIQNALMSIDNQISQIGESFKKMAKDGTISQSQLELGMSDLTNAARLLRTQLADEKLTFTTPGTTEQEKLRAITDQMKEAEEALRAMVAAGDLSTDLMDERLSKAADAARRLAISVIDAEDAVFQFTADPMEREIRRIEEEAEKLRDLLRLRVEVDPAFADQATALMASVEAKAAKMIDELDKKERRASIEDASSLFRRIQTAAASGDMGIEAATEANTAATITQTASATANAAKLDSMTAKLAESQSKLAEAASDQAAIVDELRSGNKIAEAIRVNTQKVAAFGDKQADLLRQMLAVLPQVGTFA